MKKLTINAVKEEDGTLNIDIDAHCAEQIHVDNEELITALQELLGLLMYIYCEE